MNGWDDGSGWGGWCGTGAGLGFLVTIALVGVAVWLGMSFARTRTRIAPGGDAALRILEARFARGELEREQYEEMRKTLRN